MGNITSCFNAQSNNTAKLIDLHRKTLRHIDVPVTAAELMLEDPGCVVAPVSDFRSGFKISAMKADESLFKEHLKNLDGPQTLESWHYLGQEFPGRRCQQLGLGRLENLEVLKLENEAFEGRRWDTRDGEFQKLTFLKLENFEVLTERNVASSQHFPKLQQLFLIDCYNLKEISCEIGEMATLQLIEVKGKCRKTLVESAQRIMREQREDMGNEELRLITSTVTKSAPTIRVPNEVDAVVYLVDA